ncbi:MAG: DUF2490 domain-containing protein [Saprospiraceae bacterium]|nr:DUF2490 domain-containing protein [Saprospiraceae bacterium]
MHRLLLVLALSIVVNCLSAQTDITHNFNNWAFYLGQYKLSDKWGIHLDIQYRTDERIARANQNLLRAGLQYYFKPTRHLTVGYAYINTYNAGIEDYLHEDRIWQQFIDVWAKAQVNMTHRYRLEQRFVEKSDGSNVFGHRFRYFNRTLFELTKDQEKKHPFYLALQDELFFNFFSPDINGQLIDQNRFYIGLGIFQQRLNRLEIGYMNQWINPARGGDVMNHILQLSLLHTLGVRG